ncbi:MAG: PKD domain-containing protein [Chitinophagaceae bacterium]|nr:PKD domain-containing protein [Chitinophagaceae bacterium]
MKRILVLIAITAVWSACKKDKDMNITPEFSADKQEVLAGETVTFSDLSTGPASKWKWTFEGGEPATSDLSGPAVKYMQPGTYAVTLEISNAATSVSTKKTGFIKVGYNQLVVDFSASKTTALQGETITFTDKTTGIPTTWNWTFTPESGTSISSTDQNPAIKFDNPGIYTVKLVTTNPEYNGEKTVQKMITIIDITAVTAEFSAASTATYTGGDIQFEDKTLGTVTGWTWTFEGGIPATSTEQNPKIRYNTPGRYKVKLVANNTSKNSTMEKESYIFVVPGTDLVGFFPFNNDHSEQGPGKSAVSQTGAIGFANTDRKGVTGNAGYFNGASWISTPSSNFNLADNNFSISVWIKSASTARMMVWQESGKNGSGDNQSWLRMNDNATTQFLRFNTENPGSAIISMATEGKVNDDAWHHIVCVRDGLLTKVYIDGVKVKEMSTTAVKIVTGAGQLFKIGAQEGVSSMSNYYTGMIDDLIIYKRAFTDADVTALFNL